MQTINELSSSEKSEPSCYQKSRSISSTEFKTNSLLANFKEHKHNNNIKLNILHQKKKKKKIRMSQISCPTLQMDIQELLRLSLL